MTGIRHVLTIVTALYITVIPAAVADNPVITKFGHFYNVPDHQTISPETKFKIAFDVADGAEHGKLNYQINSLARFINMHVAHGVDPGNIQLALVVHGGATTDVLTSKEYKQRFSAENATAPLLDQLLQNNTEIFVCGQSAMHHDITSDDLVPGVTMALSAMTAHAQLQQQGFTLNPF